MNRGRPFEVGNKQGKGRPLGSRNKSTNAARKLLDENGVPLTQKCIAAALRGDLGDRPEITRGSTFDQQQQIAVRLAAKGITSREDKLVFCGTVIDRDIASSKELSYLEATRVLKAADALEAVNA